MKKALTCLALWCALFGLKGQTFVDLTTEIGITHSYGGTFGSGVSFYDWNKDGWPDLSYCNKNIDPQFYINNGGSFEAVPSFITNTGNMRSLLWVDFDNDGDADISVSRHQGVFSLYRNDDGVFTDVSASAGFPTNAFKSYGHSWSDFDRDGYLDVYLANYDHLNGVTNHLLRNNGNGTFTDVTLAAGVSNGSSFSFLGVWFDANHDEWPDLYVINDKFFPNALYLNNGDGTFYDASNDSDAGIISNPMTCTVGDYDNDGDMDIYMTNTDLGNHLLAGDGEGHFYDVSVGSGAQMFEISWGAIFSDVDLDMDEDLYVCTGNAVLAQFQDKFFLNQDGNYFMTATEIFNTTLNNSYCVSEGDFDQDGDNDFAVLCALGDNSEFFRNDLAESNSITISLEGVLCNRDAIGTRLEFFANGIQNTRYTFCGENYLGQNSQYEIFGMGSADQADSLIILWPDGFTETYYDIPAGSVLHLIQGASITNVLNADPVYTLCPGESIMLDGGEFPAYLWSNGWTERYLTVTSPGYYHVQTITQEGFLVNSNEIQVIYSDFPEVYTELINIDCFGAGNGLLALDVQGPDEPFEVLWSDGSTDMIREGLEPGYYDGIVTNSVGCSTEVSGFIEQPATELALHIDHGDVLCTGSNTGWFEMSVTGGTPEYTMTYNGVNFNGQASGLGAGTIDLGVLDANGCELQGTIVIIEPSEALLGLVNVEHSIDQVPGGANIEVSGGVAPYTILWNGVEGGESSPDLDAGVHSVQVIDANECEWTYEFEVESITAIQDLEAKGITLYPNPASSEVNILIPANSVVQLLEMYDLRGQLVRQPEWLNQGTHSIELQSIATGVYLLKLTGHQGAQTIRLVVR